MNGKIWIRHGTDHPDAELNLLCFPYAGGSPGIFAGWMREFQKQINLCPVLYPGRDIRMDEPVSANIEIMAEEFVQDSEELFTRPFAVLGYCAGGLYAYETVLQAKEQYGRTPEYFLSVSFASPSFPMTAKALGIHSEESCIRYLTEQGIISREAAEDRDFLDYYLPIISGDLQALSRYHFRAEQTLDCDVYAFFGTQDTLFTPEDFLRWNASAEGKVRTQMVQGGHYCLEENRDLILSLIKQQIKKKGISDE